MINTEAVNVHEFVESEGDASFSVVVEYEGHFYYFRDVRVDEEDGSVEYELGVAFDGGAGLQPIELTEEHAQVADEILMLASAGEGFNG